MTSDRTNTAPLLLMHIPKTAGTTLRWVAERQYPVSRISTLYPGHGPQIEALATASPSRQPLAVIGHFRFGLHTRLPGGGRYVTFMRNPVDQVISHFNYLVGANDPDCRGVLKPADGLEEFLAHGWARNLQTQYICGWSAAQVEAAPDRAFERATSVLGEHFAGVGLVERFAESVGRLADQLGWRVPYFPRLNPAPSTPQTIRRQDLGRSAIREVEDANICDQRLYEHARRMFDDRSRTSPARVWKAKAFAAANWLAGWGRSD